MPEGDWLILMGMGSLFILLGLGGIMRARSVEKSSRDALSSRLDMREYLEQTPESSAPGAWRTGGWIAIVVGLFMLAYGGVLWLWG